MASLTNSNCPRSNSVYCSKQDFSITTIAGWFGQVIAMWQDSKIVQNSSFKMPNLVDYYLRFTDHFPMCLSIVSPVMAIVVTGPTAIVAEASTILGYQHSFLVEDFADHILAKIIANSATTHNPCLIVIDVMVLTVYRNYLVVAIASQAFRSFTTANHTSFSHLGLLHHSLANFNIGFVKIALFATNFSTVAVNLDQNKGFIVADCSSTSG